MAGNIIAAPLAGAGAQKQAQGVITQLGAYSLQYANTLAAGKSLLIPVSGTNFYVVASTGTLVIQPVGSDAGSYDPGTGEDLGKSGGSFTKLTITNPNQSQPVSFTVFIGTNEFIDKRLILVLGSTIALLQKTAPTLNLGANIFNVIAGNNKLFTGTALPGGRKQIVIHNLGGPIPGTGDTLLVYDFNNNLFDSIPYGPPWTVESSDYFRVNNPNIVTVSMNAGEIYWGT